MAATKAAQPVPPPAVGPSQRASVQQSPVSAPVRPLADPTQRASLYVGDLHPEVTEKDILPVFSQVGPVSSVHLCRDKFSNKSLCYAYVNFSSPSDAHTALACLNYNKLRGKSMRIMWRQRDPIMRKTGIGNLFINNLDPSITSARLQEIFLKYGDILSCKVAEENGKSRGFGFVQFDSEISAMAALNAMNGTVVEGKKLYVSKFLQKNERKDTGLGFTNLYVKNIDDNLTEDFLKEKFSEYGKVFSAIIMKDEKGKSKGFGFVNFETHEEAIKAMVALNGALIGIKNLFVGPAQKKSDRVKLLRQIYGYGHESLYQELKPSILFVDNLEVSIDDRKLEEIFSGYGKVTSTTVIRGSDGVSQGCGFVSFSNSNESGKALQSLNGTNIRGKTLYVAFVLYNPEGMQSCHTKYSPQSFCTRSLDVTASEFQPLHPGLSRYRPWEHTANQNVPIPQMTSWNPYSEDLSVPPYQNSARPFLYYGAQNCQENLSANIPLQQKLQSNSMAYRQKHRGKLSTPDVFPQGLVGTMKNQKLPEILQNKIIGALNTKDQKPSRNLEKRRSKGVTKDFSQGSVTARPNVVTSISGTANLGHVLQASVKNLQLGHDNNVDGLLPEMKKSDTQKLLK